MIKRLKQCGLLLILFFAVSCAGTTIADNPATTDASTITMAALSAGSTTASMPLALFGDDETSLSNVTIDVAVNETTVETDISAVDNFNDTTQAVEVDVADLEDGDTVAFDVHFPTGTTDTYSGTVSATEDSSATQQTQ